MSGKRREPPEKMPSPERIAEQISAIVEEALGSVLGGVRVRARELALVLLGEQRPPGR